MKKNINWWAMSAVVIIGGLVGFAGMGLLDKCTSNPVLPTSEDSLFLAIDKGAISLRSEAGSAEFTIESNTTWEVATANGQAWLSVSPASGKGKSNISLNVTENNSTIERKATVAVSWTDNSGEAQKEIVTVRQEAKEDTIKDPIPPVPDDELYMNVSTKIISFGESGGSMPLTISSNTGWTVTTCGGNWLTADKTEGNGSLGTRGSKASKTNVMLTAVANSSEKERKATVTVVWEDKKGKEQKTILSVTQKGKTTPPPPPTPFVKVSPASRNFGHGGGTTSVTVTSNTEWDVSSTDFGWLTVNRGKVAKSTSISIRAAANNSNSPRSATINITWKDSKGSSQTTPVTVNQDAVSLPKLYLRVKPPRVEFGANGGNSSITVESNTEWSVTDGAEWLQASQSNNKSVTVTATKNTDTGERSAKVTLTWKDEKGTQQATTVVVKQKGAKPVDFTVTPKNRSVAANGGTTQLTVKSNTTWKVSNNADWIKISPSEGSGGKTVSVTAVKNPNTTERKANVTFTWNNLQGTTQTNTVEVTQAGVTPPKPKPITKAEAQTIVSAGKSDARIPDNCAIVVNGTNTAYGKFRSDVANGKYSSVTISAINAWDKGGNASKITVRAMKPVKSLSNEDAQTIIISGKKDSRIPAECIIVVNGRSTNYRDLRTGIDVFGMYSNIRVSDVICDDKGNAKKITVTATE